MSLAPSPSRLSRRAWLARSAALAGSTSAAWIASPALAQQPRSNAAARTLRVVQLLDTSGDQQELSRDYSTGVRLALAEAKQSGGRVPQLVSIDTDGSPESLRDALAQVKADASQVALLGAVGGRLAAASIAAAKQAQLEIAHVAPWLADTRFDNERSVFTIFASREAQIRHALGALATVGIAELGLIYPSAREEDAVQEEIDAIATRLKLRARRLSVPRGQEIAAYAASLRDDIPAFLLFLGGSIELAQFTQGLAKQKLPRYIICLSDVDTTTLLQLNPGKSASIIFAQVVPNPQSNSAPFVRSYRSTLKALFDEAPSPVSLAGYVAGHYAARVLGGLDANASRAAVLAEFDSRRSLDLDGYRIEFAAHAGRGSTFVSQTMLGANGKLIG
ncbi:MAG TPA: ABC transporter substrate-binding protein [Burkholderiaceae bacterium]|nr:ABC transporter substrate-binding protein [Burkholderiaceae bacterium]